MLRDAEFTRLKSAGKHLFGKIFAVEKAAPSSKSRSRYICAIESRLRKSRDL